MEPLRLRNPNIRDHHHNNRYTTHRADTRTRPPINTSNPLHNNPPRDTRVNRRIPHISSTRTVTHSITIT